MARVYWRLSPAFWVDDKVVGSEDYPGWSDNAKMLAVYLLTCEHRTLPGLYRLPKAYIQEDLRWDRERLDAAFRELIRDQFLEYDGRRHIVLIMNALDYQKPEGPKQCVGTARILETLPDSPLLHRFYGIAQEKCPPLADLLPDRFRYPIDTQSIPNQNPSDTQSIQEAKEEEEAKEEDIPYGVAKIATEHVDDFADIDFGEEDESEPEPPRKPTPPSRPRSASPRTKKNTGAPPENAGVLVAYLVDHAKTTGFALTEDLKGRYARSIGQVLKTGADPPLIRQAIEQCLARNKDPTHLVFVVNDLKGGSKHETQRRSGRSENGEW